MSQASTASAVVAVQALAKHFPLAAAMPLAKPRAWVRAVDGVSFDIRAGKTLSVVGESGCGKTTLGKMILGLERPSSGAIHFHGQTAATQATAKKVRVPVEAVFQDPWSSLNPRRRVTQIIGEPLVVADGFTKREIVDRVQELLRFVGIDPAAARNFPHEFSGGQRQRIAIARALAIRPHLIVLDEPVSALDVSIRAQIINLLRDIQATRGTSYMMIAHDLATVRFLSHDVIVMYLGIVVEQGPPQRLFTAPLHPYTKALLSASLPLKPDTIRERIRLSGEVPSPVNPPSGCRFRTRCPSAMARCADERPVLQERAPDQRVACHLYD